MHRGYTAERYLERLGEARAPRSPDLAVSTDIIVGFPGETDADFERTLEVAATAEYDYAYLFIFSPRTGTEAATMDDRFVDPAVVAERFQRLKIVTEHAAIRSHQARVGRVEEVLVEGPSKKQSRAVISGRTRQNKLVHFAPPQPMRTGSYAAVEVVTGGAAPPRGALRRVAGRAVAQAADPRRRVVSRGPARPPRGDRRADGVGQVGGGDGGRRRHVGNTELVSVDSMQVYRGMDIGTAKPTAAERGARCRTT